MQRWLLSHVALRLKCEIPADVGLCEDLVIDEVFAALYIWTGSGENQRSINLTAV